MGRAGAARVAEQHDPETAVEKLAELFSNASSATTGPNSPLSAGYSHPLRLGDRRSDDSAFELKQLPVLNSCEVFCE